MPEYEITGPDGKKYQINAPEGASQDEVLSYAQQNFQQTEPPKRNWLQEFAGDADWWRHQLGNISQGASWGFADELESLITGVPHENLAAGRREYQQANPVSSGVTEVAGGLLSGGGLYKAASKLAPKTTARATSWIVDNTRPWMRWAGLGGAGGASYGAGTADPGERAEGAVTGGLLGAGGSVGLYAGGKLATGAYEKVLKPLWHKVMSSDKATARQIIERELQRSGMTPEDAMNALQEGGDERMLLDLSEYLQDLAYEAQSGAGPGRSIINEALNVRQTGRGGTPHVGQQQRILDAAGENLGAYADDARKFLANIGKEKVEQAAPYYARAHAQNIQQTPAFERLMGRIPQAAYKEARAIAQARGVGLDDLSDVEKIDYIKRGLDTLIRKGFTGNSDSVSPTLAREYLGLKNEILEYVDEAVPDFARARGIWADASDLEEAAKYGREVFRHEADEVVDYVKSLSDSEKLSFRYGISQAFRDMVERSRETGNAVLRIGGSTKQKRIIRAAFGNDEEFERFMRALDEESLYSESRRVVQHNSVTDARQQRRIERGGDIPEPSSAGATNWLINHFRPQDPMRDTNVNRLVSEMLTSQSVPGWRPPLKPGRSLLSGPTRGGLLR